MAVTAASGDTSTEEFVTNLRRSERRCLSLNLTLKQSTCAEGPRSADIQRPLSCVKYVNGHSNLKRKEGFSPDDDVGLPCKRRSTVDTLFSNSEGIVFNVDSQKSSNDDIPVTPSEMANLLTTAEKCTVKQQECRRLPIVVDFRGMHKEGQIRSAIRVPCETRIKLRLLLPRLDKLLAAMCSHQCEFKHGEGDRTIIVCFDNDQGCTSTIITSTIIAHMRKTHSSNVRVFKDFSEFNKSYPYLCELSASSFRTLSVFLDCSGEPGSAGDITGRTDTIPSAVSTPDRPVSPVSTPCFGAPVPTKGNARTGEYADLDDHKDVYRARVSRILPFLYLGNEIDSTSEQLLASHRIRSVLNLTKEAPFLDETRFNCRRLPASDMHLQDMRPFFSTAFQFIEEARCSGDAVLVHCQAGVSRSPTLVIAYLMAHSSLSFGEAYQLVKTRRPVVSPNFSFLGQLSEFESDLVSGRAVRQPNTLRDLIVAMPTSDREAGNTV